MTEVLLPLFIFLVGLLTGAGMVKAWHDRIIEEKKTAIALAMTELIAMQEPEEESRTEDPRQSAHIAHIQFAPWTQSTLEHWKKKQMEEIQRWGPHPLDEILGSVDSGTSSSQHPTGLSQPPPDHSDSSPESTLRFLLDRAETDEDSS
jgi:hypothetical protein